MSESSTRIDGQSMYRTRTRVAGSFTLVWMGGFLYILKLNYLEHFSNVPLLALLLLVVATFVPLTLSVRSVRREIRSIGGIPAPEGRRRKLSTWLLNFPGCVFYWFFVDKFFSDRDFLASLWYSLWMALIFSLMVPVPVFAKLTYNWNTESPGDPDVWPRWKWINKKLPWT